MSREMQEYYEYEAQKAEEEWIQEQKDKEAEQAEYELEQEQSQPATQSATEDKPLEVTDVIQGQESTPIEYDDLSYLTDEDLDRIVKAPQSQFTDKELARAASILSEHQSSIDTKLLDFLDSLPNHPGCELSLVLAEDKRFGAWRLKTTIKSNDALTQLHCYPTAREAIYNAMVELESQSKVERSEE